MFKLFSKKEKEHEKNKVVIIGTGAVGSSTAFSMMIQGIASEIVLIDLDTKKCEGEVLDLEHGLSFVPQTNIHAGCYDDCKDADVIVITAGIAQKTDQTRRDLAKTNSKIVKGIVGEIKKQTSGAIILMVTNPLDVTAYIAYKESGYPSNQVFGTGTTLDSARFRYFLAQEFNIAAESMGAFLIGEHGESQVPVISHSNVMGEPIENLEGYSKEKVDKAYLDTKNSAATVIEKKGYTCYAIALAVTKIVRAILFDENHIFPVSVYVDNLYGLDDIYLSLPAVINRNGVDRIIEISLDEDEKKKLKESAEIIKNNIKEIS
ncbi:MAG: L-lactate dehydrogenase [Patescibacteria group bacterium]